MVSLIESIFGVYSPVIDPVTGEIVHGASGIDWPWIVGAVVFIVVLWSFFRLLGVVLRG